LQYSLIWFNIALVILILLYIIWIYIRKHLYGAKNIEIYYSDHCLALRTITGTPYVSGNRNVTSRSINTASHNYASAQKLWGQT
jgi:hypothetical protein